MSIDNMLSLMASLCLFSYLQPHTRRTLNFTMEAFKVFLPILQRPTDDAVVKRLCVFAFYFTLLTAINESVRLQHGSALVQDAHSRSLL